MKTDHILILFMTVSLLSACEMLDSKSENSPAEDMPLIGTSWWLLSFQDEMGKRLESKMDDIVLVFMESDTLQGKALHKVKSGERAGSNSYMSTYSVDNASIEVKEGYTTHVGTPPGSRYEEYLKAKNDAVSYEIQGDRLIIYHDENGGKALHFKAGENVVLWNRE